MAAMSWLAESWNRHDALKEFRDRIIALDFDDFLADSRKECARPRPFRVTCDSRIFRN